MSDPSMITAIKQAVTIPVMAKARIGHFVEAQILEALGVDYVDESEVLTPADEVHHINKHNFKVPFVCGCRDLGEALRRVAEGASMIRTKGEAGTGNVVEAVRHCRAVQGAIRCALFSPLEMCRVFHLLQAIIWSTLCAFFWMQHLPASRQHSWQRAGRKSGGVLSCCL